MLTTSLPASESELRVFFARAKRPESLLIMVQGQVRKRRLHFDDSVESYSRAAKTYKQLGNQQAATLFAAAHERLQRILEKGAP